jgi:hypothetical protein
MPTLLRASIVTALVAVTHVSCSEGQYVPPEILLRDRRSELEALAVRWTKTGNSSFARYPSGDLRWNGSWINKTEHGFVLIGNDRFEYATLDEAARAIGTTTAILEDWRRATSELKVYSILQPTSGSVELSLEGSDWRAYGLLFVLPGREDELQNYVEAAAKGKIPHQYLEFRRLEDRWFSFVSVR